MAKKSTTQRLCSCAVTLAILGGAGYGLWYWLGSPDQDEILEAIGNFDFGDFTDVLKNFTDFEDGFDEDPYLGSNATNEWDNGRRGEGGLDLTIENALDDDWKVEFDAAIGDWENGSPDALTLTTTRVDVDHNCTQKTGVMKVCNGNYGATGWLGINEVLIQSGFIFSSVAKMNEYYLLNAEYVERQYTMCHEIGHGFGLPHTDENFYNADLGNCMDYTDNPEANMRPDVTNYNRLASVYGTVTRRLMGGGKSIVASTAVGGNEVTIPRELSPNKLAKYEAAIAELEQELSKGPEELWHGSHWRLLSTHPRGQSFSRNLGDGFGIQVNILHPSEETLRNAGN
jgi:hypothetical protein